MVAIELVMVIVAVRMTMMMMMVMMVMMTMIMMMMIGEGWGSHCCDGYNWMSAKYMKTEVKLEVAKLRAPRIFSAKIRTKYFQNPYYLFPGSYWIVNCLSNIKMPTDGVNLHITYTPIKSFQN